MSFEGYYQILCKTGHAGYLDVHSTCNEGDWRCPVCGEKAIWWNTVNTTNGEQEGYVELEEKTPNVMCTCKDCKQVHVKEPATFKIPKLG